MASDYINYIVDNNLCTRCGMCAGVCPNNVFEMNRDFLPEVVSDGCVDCGLCSDSCPGQDVDFKKLARVAGIDRFDHHEFIGHYLDYMAGYCTDPEIRSRSSSGGVVTGLLEYLLKENVVQNVVVVTDDPDRACCFKPALVSNLDELYSTTGSKYSFVNICKVFKEVMSADGKTAVVALPCQVHAIRKYMAKVPAAKKQILIIGLACSSALPPQATEFILKSNHINFNYVKTVRYRRGLWSGRWVAKMKDGSETYLTNPKNHKYVFKILNRLFPVPRCMLCIDGYNEFADVSVSDPWFTGKNDFDRYIDDKGWSLAVVRTQKGEELVRNAREKGYIYIESISESIRPTEIMPMLFEKKRFVPLRMKRIKTKGRPVPDYNIEFPRSTIRVRWKELKNRMQYIVLAHRLSRAVVAVLLKYKL